jgi:hypothetical protein
MFPGIEGTRVSLDFFFYSFKFQKDRFWNGWFVLLRFGLSWCRCDLFNATTTEKGDPLSEGYLGGLHCCTDERRCAVKEDFHGPERTLYLQVNSWRGFTLLYEHFSKLLFPPVL